MTYSRRSPSRLERHGRLARHVALACVAALALLASGCPRTVPVRPEHTPPREPPGPTMPALVPFDASTRQLLFEGVDPNDPERGHMARLERRLWKAMVLPLKPATEADKPDVLRGIGLADVLTRQLTLRHRAGTVDLDDSDAPIFDAFAQRGIVSVLERQDLFADDAERDAWFASPRSDLPSGIIKTDLRWIIGGNLLPPDATAKPDAPRRVSLWLMDRVDGKIWSGTCALDVPRLQEPRLLLLKLLTDAGQAPTEIERGDMVWTEDLSDAALQAVATAALTSLWNDSVKTRAAVEQLVSIARWSYVAWVNYAHLVALPDHTTCKGTVSKALDRAFAINPHVEMDAQVEATMCSFSDLYGEKAEMFDALQRSGPTNCSVSGKAIASIGGGREVPGSGFLAGVGGIYRGSTCASGFWREQARLAKSSNDTWVAAGLYIDAATGALNENQVDKAEDFLELAREQLHFLGLPDCLPVLSEAEIDLHEAGLALQRSALDEAKEKATAAAARGAQCLDPRVTARADNIIGLAEQAGGHYDKALAAFGRAQATFAGIGDEMNLAVTHTNIGWTRTLLGQASKGLPDLTKALELKRRVRSDGGVAVALENLGVTLMTLGRFAEAEPLFVEARGLTQDRTSQAAIANNLARIRAGQGRHDEALELLAEARALAVEMHARALEAQIEQTDGGIAVERGALDKAFQAFNGALVIRREVGDRAGEGLTLSSLMVVAARLEKRELAIVYGKLAIAAHQDVKASTKALGPEAERDFLKTREKTYRKLAELLVSAGRLVEAERVLALLKIDEADQWTRSASSATGSAAAVPLTKAEQDLEKKYRAAADKVMAVGRDYSALAAKFPLSDAETKRLAKLREQMQGANEAFGKFLASLADKKIAANGLEELREGTGIGPDLAELPGTVAVYTLVADDAYHAIVVSADAQVAESVKISATNLSNLVANLRAALQDPQSDPRIPAKELYDVLVAPIAKHLDGAQAKTIIWSLDRVLRYVPMGALWDGERWLVERWPSAVFTPASRARLKDKPLSNWRVLAAGVSKGGEGFPPLPAVLGELAEIVDDPATPAVDGALPGVEIVDDGFDRERFLNELGRKWPVVHIASHFAFEPGDKDASFLVLGKGRLTISELETLPNLFQGVDLLTLSACNTATGDAVAVGDAATSAGREVESFAVLAQRKGARAVLATLWPVADQSTGRLMQRFYQLHNQAGTSKLEALRQAQLELMHGQLAPAADAAAPGPAADWSHPYYWAPFVLVGNTL